MKSVYPLSAALESTLDRIPERPGVYQYFDETGTIIYVGKAKNLRRRVYSYFTKTHDESPKTRVLVKRIHSLVYIVVDTEEDALLLENNLIKQHKPRYNVLLKDDKTYPSICIKREPFPRVFQTRQIIQDGSEYYGPYSSTSTVKALLWLIRQVYPIRTCKLPLLKKDIEEGRYNVCLEYHIKKCLGPCVGLQTEMNYLHNIEEVREILKGNIHLVSKHLLHEMSTLASELRFEEAQVLKDKYDLIEQYKSKSMVVNSNYDNVDVFAYDDWNHSAIVNYLHIRHGSIVQGLTLEYKKRLEETKEELFSTAIYEIRQRLQSTSKELIVPFSPDIVPQGLSVIIPVKGDRKKLLDLSLQNVRQYKLDLMKQAEQLNPEQRATRLLTQVKKDLHLHELPLHIECFDNSNIQGSNPVAACVVFKQGKPSKKDYRHFNIKTVVGPDDFASMEEVLRRRYGRLLDENQPLPQLVVVDGGKGQLSSAVTVFQELGLMGRLQIMGIAKNLEELFFPGDNVPLYLDKTSETLRLIQQMRDEAHRFGITFHRKKRSQQATLSLFDEIPGIGEKTKTALLSTFKSMKRVKEASIEEIEAVVGPSKAQKISVFLQGEAPSTTK
jgi:excinuclease ABC subunit C